MKVDIDLEKIIMSRKSGDDFYNNDYLLYQMKLWAKYYNHFEKKIQKVKKQTTKNICNEQMEYSKCVMEKYQHVIMFL